VKIDATGVRADGETFANVRSWKALYEKREAELAHGFTRQFLTYAAGAPPRFRDQALIDAIVKEAADENYGIRSLIRACLTSPVFLTK